VLEPRTPPPPGADTPAANVAVQAPGNTQPTNKVTAASTAGGGIGAIIASGMSLYGEAALREVLANFPIGEKLTDLICFVAVASVVYVGTKYGAQWAAYNVLDKPNVPLAPVSPAP
jgi:predicted lipid-binding transport protein (Tim44 family)